MRLPKSSLQKGTDDGAARGNANVFCSLICDRRAVPADQSISVLQDGECAARRLEGCLPGN